MNKRHGSTKIAIGFVVICGVVYFGWQKLSDVLAMGVKYGPVMPGNVNIVGIDPGSGYRIIVANQVAQLVEASDKFGAGDSGEGGSSEGAVKKRIPISDMLGAIRGEPKAIGAFISKMNDIKQDDNWPSQPELVTWTAEDIKKAISGDTALRKKLETQLNMRLDGTPLPQFSRSAIFNGIIIDSPVKLTVNPAGVEKTVVGRVQEAFKPRLLKAVEEDCKEKPNLTTEMMAAYYTQEAGKVLASTGSRENVLKTLQDRISDRVATERAIAPEKVLHSAFVVVNEKLLTDASYETLHSSDGKPFYDMTIQLNDEGRRRLWQYSKRRPGSQLLFMENGVAIAAPKIQHELAMSNLTITQIYDEGLVKEAVAAIKGNRTAER